MFILASATTGAEIQLYLLGAPHFAAGVYATDGGGNFSASNLNGTPDTQRHHVCTQWDGSEIRVYIDGVAGDTYNGSAPPLDFSEPTSNSWLLRVLTAEDSSTDAIIGHIRLTPAVMYNMSSFTPPKSIDRTPECVFYLPTYKPEANDVDETVSGGVLTYPGVDGAPEGATVPWLSFS